MEMESVACPWVLQAHRRLELARSWWRSDPELSDWDVSLGEQASGAGVAHFRPVDGPRDDPVQLARAREGLMKASPYGSK